MIELLLYFFIYSFLGWLCECLYCGLPKRTWINRGFLEGPYCPIYGFGALLVLHVLNPLSKYVVVVFIAAVVLTSALEYITSYLMELWFHTRWWDYSNYHFQLHGRICLKNSLLFGCMGLVVTYLIHPFIMDMVRSLPLNMRIILVILLLVIFLADATTTAYALIKKNVDFHKVEQNMKALQEEFKINVTQSGKFVEKLSEELRNNMDEAYASHMIQAKEQLERILHSRRHIITRLQKAFPQRRESAVWRNAEKFVELLKQFMEGSE